MKMTMESFTKLDSGAKDAINSWLRQHDIEPNDTFEFSVVGDTITASQYLIGESARVIRNNMLVTRTIHRQLISPYPAYELRPA